jgi:alkylation response protein AidB-like acyl-CoA dehydrogenase
MEFDFTEEQKMLRDTVRNFAENELVPAVKHVEETAEYPAEEIKKMAGLGLFGLFIPERYGGSGRGLMELCIAVEELAGVSAAIDNYLRISSSLAIVPILEYGTEAQKQQYLLPHATGERLACFALTESEAGSDPSSMSTTARRQDGGYVINGSKLFITNAEYAGIVVVFTTVDRSLGRKGITAFVMSKDSEGIVVGRREEKMGMRGLLSSEITFDNCFVPEDGRIGEEGQGLRIALDALDVSRVTVGAEAVGISRAAYEAALAYAKQRKQFGEAIAGFQSIQWMLSDMATQIDAARLMTYRAASLHDTGQPFVKEAAMAKVFASEVSNLVTDKALQIHGGYGYTKDYPLERYLRDARITEIYEGTSEMMRMTIARNLLRDG